MKCYLSSCLIVYNYTDITNDFVMSARSSMSERHITCVFLGWSKIGRAI